MTQLWDRNTLKYLEIDSKWHQGSFLYLLQILLIRLDFSIDEGGSDGGREAVVDVDDGDAGSAAIKHCQKGRDAHETGSIADTRWNRNNGTAY